MERWQEKSVHVFLKHFIFYFINIFVCVSAYVCFFPVHLSKEAKGLTLSLILEVPSTSFELVYHWLEAHPVSCELWDYVPPVWLQRTY